MSNCNQQYVLSIRLASVPDLFYNAYVSVPGGLPTHEASVLRVLETELIPCFLGTLQNECGQDEQFMLTLLGGMLLLAPNI